MEDEAILNLYFARDEQAVTETALVLEELAGCIAGPGRVDDRLNGQELARTIRSFLDTLPIDTAPNDEERHAGRSLRFPFQIQCSQFLIQSYNRGHA